MKRGAGTAAAALASILGRVLPERVTFPFVREVARRQPGVILEAIGPIINRRRTLDTMPFDLPIERPVRFENLVGLFASTPLDHAVIAMTVRQTAYLYGLVRSMAARKVIEIGRYKGGSTLVIAAAMDGAGDLWSIDLGVKEQRLRPESPPSYDGQLHDALQRLGLKAHLLVGDSRTISVDTGDVDLVFIDGDHSYEGVKNDFLRFGTRVRLGGSVLFDDAFAEELFPSHVDSVGRLVDEICAGSEFKLAKRVDRLAHLTRVAPPAAE